MRNIFKSSAVHAKKFFKKLGPGLVTGASDDEASGILTYLQAGAVMGLQTLWTTLVTLPMMYVVQEMCGRIGFVTNKGLIKIIKEHYPKIVLYGVAFFSVTAITVNVAADLLASGIILEKFSDIDRMFWIPLISLIIVASTILFSYRRFAGIMKWLTLSLFFYVISVFVMDIEWLEAIKATFTPTMTWNKDMILLIAAILGTTVSPYLFFWQANEEAEEREEHARQQSLKRSIITKHELKFLKVDTFIGMLFSNMVMWFIVVGASNIDIDRIHNFDDAALALQPLMGPYAYLAFGIGIIGTTLLAIPVLAGGVGYILAEVFNWNEGMSKPFNEAKGFYWTIIGTTIVGIALNFLAIDPIQLLIYTAVFYTLITPPLIFIIMKIANDAKIMNSRVNSRMTNVVGTATILFTGCIALAYIYLSYIK